MSLHPHIIAPVPEETARVARAAFPKGHPYLTFREALGTIFQDEDFASLYAHTGQPGFTPWRLALVTILQFRENLADRQAAEAVRARIDWKYLLSLELTDPGFDFSVLSAFRDRLLAGSAKSSSSTSSWSAVRDWACSRRGGSSAPTPRTCWPRFVSSTVSNSSPKPYGRP